MYSQNERISLRQLKRLIVFDLFGVLSLITPYVISRQAGYDGLGAFLFAVLLLVFYLMILFFYLKQIKKPYMNYLGIHLGRFFTLIFGLLYIVKFFITLVMLTKIFINLINTTILPDYSAISIGLPLIAVAGYLAYKGIEVRARYVEVLYFIVLVPIVALYLFTLKDIEIANLTPIFQTDVKQIFHTGFLFFLLFNQLELLLFIKPNVKPKKPQSSVETGMLTYTSQGIIIIVIFCVLTFVLTVGLLGETASATSLWSAASIFELVKFPWSLLNRQDSIIIALWLLTVFSSLSGFLYYIAHIIKELTHHRSGNVFLPILAPLVFLASILPMDIRYCYDWFMKYMIYIGLPQSILLPLIPIFMHWIKSSKKKVGQSATILFLVIILLQLNGCTSRAEVENRDFVQVLGIDYERNEYIVYYALPDLGVVSDQPTADTEQLLRQFQSADLYKVEEEYQLSSEKKLDIKHLKAIVIGENLARNKKAMEDFLWYCENHYEISKSTFVFLTNSNLSQVMDFNKKVPDGLGKYLEQLQELNLYKTSQSKVSLGSLINERNNTDMCVSVPVIAIQSNNLEMKGEGLIDNSYLASILTVEESKYANLLRGYGNNSKLFLSNIRSNKEQLVIRLSQLQNSNALSMENGVPYLTVKISGMGRIEQGASEFLQYTTTERLAAYKKMESKVNRQITTTLQNQIEKIMGEEQIDYLNILRKSRYSNRDIYAQYKNRQDSFLKDLKIKVTVDLSLNHYQ